MVHNYLTSCTIPWYGAQLPDMAQGFLTWWTVPWYDVQPSYWTHVTHSGQINSCDPGKNILFKYILWWISRVDQNTLRRVPWDFIAILVQAMAWAHQLPSLYLNQCWLNHWYIIESLRITGLILGLRPANEGRCYFVTTSLLARHKPRISPGIILYHTSGKL